LNNNNLSERIINALSYLSILFLPVIFPLIVWIVAKNTATAQPSIAKNACYAFWSQIFPALYVLAAVLAFSVLSLDVANFHGGALFGIFLTFALLIALLLFIFNIAMAVKMLIGRE
jgi:uncharacterized Tic20 family protein